MASLLTVSRAEIPAPRRYIITLKEEAAFAAHISSAQTTIASTVGNITHELSLINGYAGEFSQDDLNDLRTNPDIDSIEEDAIYSTCYETQSVQTDATWGLGRISSQEKLTGNDLDLNFTYNYEGSAGNGVDVYVVDTGIYTQHPAFEGRAKWGKTFGGYPDADGNGHGTHCAGTVASKPYGVAKSSTVIAVKVLSDSGRGLTSDIISGLVWVSEEVARTGRPSVVSMSLGGGPSLAMDKAVKALYDNGIAVVVAAGNDNRDASRYSPARSAQAITVAASTIDDTKATFSNFGAPVDIWAPGFHVTSTWNDGGTKNINGTSMATPHVAGFAAYLLGIDSTLTPDQIAESIKEKSLKDVLSGVPAGTVNRLLNNKL